MLRETTHTNPAISAQKMATMTVVSSLPGLGTCGSGDGTRTSLVGMVPQDSGRRITPHSVRSKVLWSLFIRSTTQLGGRSFLAAVGHAALVRANSWAAGLDAGGWSLPDFTQLR
jgi:hypothetical protein